jgi:hypothetical protein
MYVKSLHFCGLLTDYQYFNDNNGHVGKRRKTP